MAAAWCTLVGASLAFFATTRLPLSVQHRAAADVCMASDLEARLAKLSAALSELEKLDGLT